MINVPLMKWFVSLKKQAKKEVIWLILLGAIGYLFIQNNGLRDKAEALGKEKEKQIIDCQNERNADNIKHAQDMIDYKTAVAAEVKNFMQEKIDDMKKVDYAKDSALKVLRNLTESINKKSRKIDKILTNEYP